MEVSAEPGAVSHLWYGPVATDIQASRETRAIGSVQNIVERLKAGDFSATADLAASLLAPLDEESRLLGIRVFVAVTTHDGLNDPRWLNFLDHLNDTEALTFGGVADETLSYEILPYLFALAEEWRGSEVEEFARGAIDRIVDYEAILGEQAPLEQIADLAAPIMAARDHSVYYYRGEPAHPAPLCKQLAARAASATYTRETLGMFEIPRMLSIWSGVLCPVDSGTLMTQDRLGEVLQYIKTLAERDWVAGAKYFYGHRVG